MNTTENNIYNNGNMKIELISVVRLNGIHDLLDNYAIVYRHNIDDYVVVRGFRVYDDTKCDWNYAIEYDIENYSYAKTLLLDKIK